MIGAPNPMDGCRVAPYVNMPSMRLAFDRLHMQHLGHLDAAHLSIHHHPPPPSLLLYPTPHYAMNFPTLTDSSFKTTKNSSIADLRLKARKHAAALGL